MLNELHIQVFADGADRDAMLELAAQPHIAGLTTNPTLMRKAGITDYRAFALSVLSEIKEKPISFEVFSDDFREMERQAHEIASWGENVFVKIPVTNTRAESSAKLIRRLARAGVKQNVTALMTFEQVTEVSAALGGDTPAFISVFAGRIADTGRDPIPIMEASVRTLGPFHNQRLIWASPREVLNIFQADQIGCHVITVTHDLLKKLGELGKDLSQYSLETVQMFHNDAQAAGFTLPILPHGRAIPPVLAA
jgi:transaldolase